MHRYSHLLSGAASGLECVSCLIVEHISRKLDTRAFIDIVSEFFRDAGEEPIIVHYSLRSNGKSHRLTWKMFERKFRYHDGVFGDDILDLTAVSSSFDENMKVDTWTARCIVSINMRGHSEQAFFQMPSYSEKEQSYMANLANKSFGEDYLTAYVFPFPWRFSPLAYFNGIGYSPNVRSCGTTLDRDLNRIANWARLSLVDSNIYIEKLRDVYQYNILSELHLTKLIEKYPLAEWIEKDQRRGVIKPLMGKFAWSLCDTDLVHMQAQLDSFGMLLSGIEPS